MRCFGLVLGFGVVLGLLAGCGSPTAPTPPANLVVVGTLSVLGCQTVPVNGLITCATFSGAIRNDGSGCAANVRGTTIAQLLNGTQIGTAGWSLGITVRPGEVVTYSGGPLLTAPTGQWQYDTAVSWDNVRC